MWVPGTVGISSGELRAPPFRHVVTESQAGPPQGTALTPGSAYSRATPALRPTPASFIQIVARNHPDCRRADECGSFAKRRTDGTEDIGRSGALICWRSR